MEEEVIAETLASSQLEYTKSRPYVVAPTSYEAITALPTGYSVSIEATPIGGRDTNIQKITVTVQHHGRVLLAWEDFKLDR